MADVNDIKIDGQTIMLDKERHMKYTLSSLAILEQKYGSVDAALAKVDAGSIQAIIDMMHAGLRWEDKELTEEAVGDMIDIAKLQKLADSIGSAMVTSMPKAGSKNPNVSSPAHKVGKKS